MVRAPVAKAAGKFRHFIVSESETRVWLTPMLYSSTDIDSSCLGKHIGAPEFFTPFDHVGLGVAIQGTFRNFTCSCAYPRILHYTGRDLNTVPTKWSI